MEIRNRLMKAFCRIFCEKFLEIKGFIEGCGGSLTQKEIRMLPMGAKLMTLE